MGILVGFVGQFRTWDKTSKMAFGFALLLLLVAIVILLVAPPGFTDFAVMSIGGLLVALQVIVLWGNRSMVTAQTEARRHYIDGNYASARDVLESELDRLNSLGQKPNGDMLAFLGNTYRQLGELDKSLDILTQAIESRPKSHFSHYGFGRTLLAKGEFAAAAEELQLALKLGAPQATTFDLGHALVRAGDKDAASKALQSAIAAADEPQQVLMTQFWLHQLDGQPLPSDDLISQGSSYWQEEAARFADTPYGKALYEDLRVLSSGQS